ncbi:Hypothetical protein NTJ_02720 [Nesidiocoris tenuis]|uniref:Uncharacterized protein n=1 Tax=Nesidiocoris tenuis TaxID=355587 RepID=A0ABN7AFA1_9HEMI|nr:Hypothetical protein NTJ_02720 [Nesidiocoris tenuis]
MPADSEWILPGQNLKVDEFRLEALLVAGTDSPKYHRIDRVDGPESCRSPGSRPRPRPPRLPHPPRSVGCIIAIMRRPSTQNCQHRHTNEERKINTSYRDLLYLCTYH